MRAAHPILIGPFFVSRDNKRSVVWIFILQDFSKGRFSRVGSVSGRPDPHPIREFLQHPDQTREI